MDNIKHYGQALGAGELYPLFACMLTARSWKSVTTGIEKVAPNTAEVGIIIKRYCIQTNGYWIRCPI